MSFIIHYILEILNNIALIYFFEASGILAFARGGISSQFFLQNTILSFAKACTP